MIHHLIFEGAELAGKSWLMSQVYDYLEPKYNRNKVVLDGCHWFNCDIGIYGTEKGLPVINHYIKIFNEIQDKNLIVEKLHLSDIVYNRLYRKAEVDYAKQEKLLNVSDFKIILCIFPEDKSLLEKRIKDRLNLYPHYEAILKSPEWYIEQQREYIKEIKKTRLPYLIVETDKLPDQKPVKDILDWLGEKNR